jgi:hypothetical protein
VQVGIMIPGWLPLVREIKELYCTQILIEEILDPPMEDIEINSKDEDHSVCVKEKMDALSFLNYIVEALQNLEDDIW